jgi:hypothetical protein
MLVAWLVSTTLRVIWCDWWSTVKSKNEEVEAEGCVIVEIRLQALLYLHQAAEGWKVWERIGEGY